MQQDETTVITLCDKRFILIFLQYISRVSKFLTSKEATRIKTIKNFSRTSQIRKSQETKLDKGKEEF